MILNSLQRIATAARVFAVAAVLGLGLISPDARMLLGVSIVVATAGTAIYLSVATPLDDILVIALEATVVGLVIGLTYPSNLPFLPYPVALALIAGLSRGVVGVSAVVLVQCALIAAISALPDSAVDGVRAIRQLSPWLLTSIGSGLLGAWLKKTSFGPLVTPEETSYQEALRLMMQLRTVARRLSSGLDPATIAESVRAEIRSSLGSQRAGVFLKAADGTVSQLTESDLAGSWHPTGDWFVTDERWSVGRPFVQHSEDGETYTAALPLRVGDRTIGFAVAELKNQPRDVEVGAAMGRLDALSLRLETALVFDEIRSMATLEERRRLAREIHDGIAQDVASLGYAIDDMLATPTADSSDIRLIALRNEVTRVVNELRLSIHDLRAEVPGGGLGTALSDYVRQIGADSNFQIHLTLSEGSARLRPEVEIELLRIAQEAITNVRKHAHAENLWVTCEVQPPYAHVAIRDDGLGRVTERRNSYGLRVMAERAARVGAVLDVAGIEAGRPGSGTLVTVTLGQQSASEAQREVERHDAAR